MTPRLNPQQRIKRSAKAIAYLGNPAFGLNRSPERAALIAEHKRQLAQDIRLVIPKMKGARS